jgi:hypothetical protein
MRLLPLAPSLSAAVVLGWARRPLLTMLKEPARLAVELLDTRLVGTSRSDGLPIGRLGVERIGEELTRSTGSAVRDGTYSPYLPVTSTGSDPTLSGCRGIMEGAVVAVLNDAVA